MRRIGRGVLLLVLALGMMCEFRGGAVAQTLATTTVSDTVLRADGTAAAGSVVVSWGAFTTANGISVPAGSTTVTLGANGALSLALAPNAGATPMGSYYTAVYHLNDGTVSKEFWVIPPTVAGGGAVKLAGIRNQVLPTSVAMQTVSKQYVDNAIAQAQIGPIPMDQSPYVLKAGDTMTGPLALPGDPATANQAADKHYVDANISAVTTGLGGKVSLLPSTSQQVQQPPNTELDVNRLNGTLYGEEFGTEPVEASLASPECGSGAGCTVVLEPNNPAKEAVTIAEIPAQSRVVDERNGGRTEFVTDPLNPGTSSITADRVLSTTTRSQVAYSTQVGNQPLEASALELQENALAGGSNQFPAAVETPPYFKSTYHASKVTGTYYTEGQHVTSTNLTTCYGVGDCLGGSQVIVSSGGFHDPSDEGTHPDDLQVVEDYKQYEATCTSGCTLGSTSLTTVATQSGGTQGEGRFLLDLNPANVISTGQISGGTLNNIFAVAQFSGTNFPVSVFLATAAAATSQAKNISPGLVTLPIETSGVPSGFATSTSALPATSGVACVADQESPAQHFPNYETANYTVVDATHVQLTLNKVHASGAVVSVGGLCGYGLVQTADNHQILKQVFPVVGSISGTALLYADAGAALVGLQNTTSAYANISFPVASIARSGNVVTATLGQSIGQDVNGLTMTVNGVADPSYNGSFAVTSTSAYTLTYPDNGPDSTSNGGTISFHNGGFALYPMAEVLSVYNPATRGVDGTMTLAPNTVAWATGDAVEEPHYYSTVVYPDSEIISQFMPRPPIQILRPGKIYQDSLSVNFTGWDIANQVPANFYYGGGGTHLPPDAAYRAEGVWRRTLELDAGTESLLYAHCNLEGCNRWNSDYNLVAMDSATGTDALRYSPESNQLAIQLGGHPTTFGPSTITTDVINANTVNATKLSGTMDASTVATGVLNPARLPLFGPSGATHAAGAVPDPGATAGASRYLREDGTWSAPAGNNSGASSSGAVGAVQVAATGGAFADAGCTASSGVLACPGSGSSFGGSGAGSITTTKAAGDDGGGGGGFIMQDGAGNKFLFETDGGHAMASARGVFGFGFNGITVRSSSARGSSDTPVFGVYAAGASGYGVKSSLFYVSNNGRVTSYNSTFDDGAGNATLSGNMAVAGRYNATLHTPASSSEACTAGDFTDDASYHYVCVAANTWKRVALSSF